MGGRAEGGQLGLTEERIAAHIEELEYTFVCEPTRVLFNCALAGENGSKYPPSVEEAGGAEELVRGESDEAIDGMNDPVQIKQVACGDVHSCALDSIGGVWSWGWGEFGQLGLGFSAATYELGMGGVGSKRLTPEVLQPKHFEHMRIQSI